MLHRFGERWLEWIVLKYKAHIEFNLLSHTASKDFRVVLQISLSLIVAYLQKNFYDLKLEYHIQNIR